MKTRDIAFSIVALLWMLFSITFNSNLVLSSRDHLADFGSFLASGIELQAGRNPYSTTSPLVFEIYFPKVQSGGRLPNLNPPITLMIFNLLADSNYILATNIWRILSLVIFIVCVLILSIQYKPSILRVLWAFALAGLWHTLGLGQIYTPLLLLVCLIWMFSLKNKQLQVGIFLGLLISIKPNFIVWLLLLLLTKNWTAIKASITTVLIVGLLPLAIMPSKVYLQWLEAANVDNKILTMPGNSSLAGLTSRVGHPEIGAGLAVLLILVCVIFFYRARNNGQKISSSSLNSAGILLSLLVSPISWAGYTILMLPIFLSQKEWNASTMTAAAILTVPFNFILHLYALGSFNYVFWGWWYGIAMVTCFINLLIELYRPTVEKNLEGEIAGT